MLMPGDHWDIPPKSEWLNWAMLPPPDRSARRIVRTASGQAHACLAILTGGDPPSLDLLVFQRGGTAPDLEALI
jgi:hypothetical protein